jgi:hypothetical protein
MELETTLIGRIVEPPRMGATNEIGLYEVIFLLHLLEEDEDLDGQFRTKSRRNAHVWVYLFMFKHEADQFLYRKKNDLIAINGLIEPTIVRYPDKKTLQVGFRVLCCRFLSPVFIHDKQLVDRAANLLREAKHKEKTQPGRREEIG